MRMLTVIARTRPMASAIRPKEIPPIAPAISATDVRPPIVALESPNSFWMGTMAKVNRRKSIESSIQPSCAAKSARQALRSTATTDIFAVYPDGAVHHRGHRDHLEVFVCSVISVVILYRRD